MRICFFTENYYIGGLDTFIINLVNHWPNEKDEITIICNKSHPGLNILKNRITRLNVTVKSHDLLMSKDIEFELKNVFNVFFKIFFFIFRYILFLWHILNLRKVVKVDDYDELLVINGGYPGGYSCRAMSIFWGIFKKKKSIHNFHNFATSPRVIVRFIENYIDYFVQKHTKYFVTVSKTCENSLSKRKSIKNHEGLRFIYNGININNNVLPVDIRGELSLNANSKICLILATYEERKGHKFLIDSFQKVFESKSDVFLVCCGYGSDEEFKNVEDYIKEKNLSSKIFMYNYREDGIGILSVSDLLVISSKEFESFGLTAIEGMKYKIPVISTNTGGLKEVIKDGEGGFLYDYGDNDGFAKKIIELLNNESLCIEQGELGYKRFNELFHASVMAQKYWELLVLE
ncbi:glycosyltransferase family 4 protein [Flavobacterium sp. F-65]|uniref:Glycosyltransferase family 4 protein n=1 Tax=Flavobacterium pisciphilum TaxID=2893755 RepID=A0ABS8MU73_9FLAO|nr:glycosyltransferase family 4 protein [Flavobacterium sp. F-65]MCC9071726.1 glycosyltransferase family 4 protein [Flavobacterium sp. F-65]